jgi:exo-beta-1,3-glucanase (GH17 family)
MMSGIPALLVLTAVIAVGIGELSADSTILRENPFVIRPFSPAINGQPIFRGVAYGCYRHGQAPWGPGPSDVEIREDLAIIAQHWNLIRVYNADNDSERILKSIADNRFPIKVMLGIWLENEHVRADLRAANQRNVERGIEFANRYPGIIVAVNVGNETEVAWSAHRMIPGDLIRHIRSVRSRIKQPVTTADDYSYWDTPESQAVADELDFIVVHAHPLWNSRTLSNTFSWLDETMASVQHHGKPIVLGEIGWATNFNRDKTGPGEQGTLIKAEVSVEGQSEFLKGLDTWIIHTGTVSFLFEAFDESWKGGDDDPRNVEKNWGVFDENRHPKTSTINEMKTSIDIKNGSGGRNE